MRIIELKLNPYFRAWLRQSVFSIFCLMLSFIWVNAQSETVEKPQVESKAFDVMLSTMIKESVPLMDVDKLAENQEKYVLLDAREFDEYKVSHLEGAYYIGHDKWDKSVLDDIDKDAEIVIYCSIGVRSEKIGEELMKLGYKNVYNLYGSIFEWANKGYPIVDNAGYPTMKIHGYSWLWGKWMTNDQYEKVYE